MTDRDPALEPFDALIGTWATEATHPLVDAVVPGTGHGLVMEYFDSRGVRRTYGISLEDGVLRIWRDAPGFDQRYSATLAPDTFEGQSQLAETPGDWHDDLKVTYRRR